MIRIYWLAPLAFGGCALALILLLRRAKALPVDMPNERSLHARPTPRIGGLGMMLGLLAACIAVGSELHLELLSLAGLALGLSLFSLLDDWRGLSVPVRFATHFLAAYAAVWALLPSGVFPFTVCCVLGVVWLTNLFNFMDGADGLAGGMALCGFAAYGVAALLGGDYVLATFSTGVAAAALGFLLFNFPPARVFMGDAGSIPLGFLAAALGMYGWRAGLWYWAFPMLVFSPFIVDASLTLARRAWRGEKVWRAHREHYYQRLVRMGWSHRRLALAEYGLMFSTALSALVVSAWPAILWPVLACWGLVYGMLAFTIDHRWESHEVA